MQHNNRRNAASRITAFASITTLVFVIALLLAACGSNGGTGGSPTTTPATVQKCGTVHTLPDGKLNDPTTAKATEDCFWSDYQKCQPATIVYSAAGVDTINTSTFTLSSVGGKCTIKDAVQFSIAPATPSAPKTYTCAGMTQQQDGLQISACGDRGDVLIPTPTGM